MQFMGGLALLLVGVVTASAEEPATAPAGVTPTAAYVQTLNQAREKSAARQWKDAAALWTEVVRVNPVNPYFWSSLGYARLQAGDYKESIVAHERAMELGAPAMGRAVGAYRIASAYARAGEKELALQWLARAMERGFPALEMARTDEALQSLHGDPRFQKLLGTEDVSHLTRDEGWRYDLDVLAREVQRKGFLIQRPVTREQFDGKVAELRKAIPKLDDWQVVLAMMKLMVFLDDGHTALWDFGDNKFFDSAVPLQFYWFEEGLFVLSADPKYKDLVGAQVLAFDGRPAVEVLTALEPYANADHHNPLAKRQQAYYKARRPAMLQALGLVKQADRMTLTVRDLSGTKREAAVVADKTFPDIWNIKPNPPSWVSYASTLPSPPLYLRNMEKRYWFEYLPEQKTVFFAFNQVLPDEQESMESFVARLFAFIDEHEVDKLVIDMRWNNGGDTSVGEPLLLAVIGNKKVNQSGKLFVITGRRTYSAAQNMATYLERYTKATFVGEPTGSSPNFVGEEDPVTLPYSKLMANVSHLYWQSAGPRDERVWLAPSVYIPPTWADFRAGRDAALEAVLAYP
jgi:tetratricopeptide (TPR) repeat protein